MKKINTEMMEFNKPSELCQIVYVNNDGSSLYDMSPIQLDLMNNFLYDIRRQININNIDIAEHGSTVFDFGIKDIADIIGVKNNDYRDLIKKIKSLHNLSVLINSLGKNKHITEQTITHFIQEIKLINNIETKKKQIKITMSNTLINSFMNRQKGQPFTKMYFKIQMSMKSKYSKLLYELLKDYEGIKSITIPYGELLDLLNVTSTTQDKWSIFKSNILDKAVKEINTKSDIKISYEPIKEKPKGERMQVTKVKFNISKQNDKHLEELGLIEEQLSDMTHYNKSKSKLDTLVKNGYKVIDKEAWIKSDIRKNNDRYNDEVVIDNFMKDTDQELRNKIYEFGATYLDADDPLITIEDYKIINLFTKDAITKNPTETCDKLEEIIELYYETN